MVTLLSPDASKRSIISKIFLTGLFLTTLGLTVAFLVEAFDLGGWYTKMPNSYLVNGSKRKAVMDAIKKASKNKTCPLIRFMEHVHNIHMRYLIVMIFLLCFPAFMILLQLCYVIRPYQMFFFLLIMNFVCAFTLCAIYSREILNHEYHKGHIIYDLLGDESTLAMVAMKCTYSPPEMVELCNDLNSSSIQDNELTLFDFASTPREELNQISYAKRDKYDKAVNAIVEKIKRAISRKNAVEIFDEMLFTKDMLYFGYLFGPICTLFLGSIVICVALI